ncbi:MAG: hypothetical protein V3R82_04085 [Candidatus Hydrothermarchaeales archaeon]
MNKRHENLIMLAICILGLFFNYLALKITLSPIIIGTAYLFWIVVQSAIGLYLVVMLTATLRNLWVEWRWQPTQLR